MVDELVARALTLAAEAFDDDAAAAVAELGQLAGGDDQALDQAITACLAQPASLAARRRAMELLARALYEPFPPSHQPTQPVACVAGPAATGARKGKALAT